MLNLSFFLAIVPWVIFLLLLLWKKTALLNVSFATLFVTTLLAVVYWKILPWALLVSYLKGLFIAFDILVIIFGALFFLEISRKFHLIENFAYYLENISRDYRIRVILVAWFLENFLEGTAGFGTPSMVAAPLLIGMGLAPLKAVIISLLGNSASVVFGAAGTPIRIGFADLDISMVPLYSALFNIIGALVPVFMLWILTWHTKDRKEQFFDCLPFALWSGFAFVVAALVSVPLGQEFPSIIGSVIGLVLVFLTLKLGIFSPRNIHRHSQTKHPELIMPSLKVFAPYILVIILLVLSKIFLADFYLTAPFSIPYKFSLFNPGLVFIITGLMMIFLWQKKKTFLKPLLGSFKKSFEPFLVIFFMSAIVQIMIYSSQNLSSLPSIIDIIAKIFETKFLPFLAPFMGAFGSFLTGSATISNIMFGKFTSLAATFLDFQPNLILSLLVVGAAAGNMIALADILATEAAVGLRRQERQILKGVILPCLIYLILVALSGILFT